MMVAFLNQMSSFSRNLNHYWKCREQKGNFQITLVIIFGTLQYFSTSPIHQKQNETLYLVSQIWCTSCFMSYQTTWDLRKVGKIRKVSNLGGEKAQCPVSLKEILLQQQQTKIAQKWISSFSFPVQYYWISVFCFGYFVRDFSLLTFSKSQSPTEIVFLLFKIHNEKHFCYDRVLISININDYKSRNGFQFFLP